MIRSQLILPGAKAVASAQLSAPKYWPWTAWARQQWLIPQIVLVAVNVNIIARIMPSKLGR